jgi:signal transduction histidine kinase
MTLLLLLLILALFNGVGWYMYRRAMTFLEEDLGRHLVSIGRGVAASLDAEGVRDLQFGIATPKDAQGVSDGLSQWREIYGLDGLTLLSPDLGVIATAGGDGIATGDSGVLALAEGVDFEAVRDGEAVHAPLLTVGGETFKSAYVPVIDRTGGVVALLALDASASFVENARDLSRVLVAVLAASGVATTLVALLFQRRVRALVQREEERRHRDRIAALTRMAAGVAHEIRNPLGIIRASAEMLAGDLAPGDPRRETLDSIVSEVDRLDNLLSNSISIARPARPAVGVVDVVASVRDCVRQIEPDFGRSGVTVAADVGALPQVRGNASETRQVLLNLLLNAREAMPRGGRIRVSGRERWVDRTARRARARDGAAAGPLSGRFVEVAIADEGQGMTPEVLEQIFDPFFTTKDGGTGLGLSVVHGIVTGVGGYLDVDSKVGRGTTIRVGLPVASD